jgi:prepilin-type N-terminal cleavage/methylation domain-containing protein/prepilin-type processing-associated H-X9-DG protein
MNIFPSRSSRYFLHHGFTLVELLVVIAIIGVLIGLLLPAVQAARESARRSQCTNNMKQVALALHGHHDASNALPPSATNNTVDSKGRAGWSWMLFVLPFIEQSPLHDACMGQDTWRMQVPSYMDTTVVAMARAPITQFICPTDTVGLLAPEAKVNSAASWLTFTASKANYLANGGSLDSWGGSVDQQMRASQGAFRKVKGATFKDFTDGLSKTFLIGEVGGVPATASDADRMPGIWSGTTNQDNGHWEIMRYTANKLNSGAVNAFGSFHPGGANFALADGSVRFIQDTIQANPLLWGFYAAVETNISSYLTQMASSSRGVWERLSTRSDGLTVGDY